jgi:hypothetical protein
MSEIVREYSREAAARLQGKVSALEFCLETEREQMVREQILLAKLAVAATGCGIQLTDVFNREEDVYHVRECVRVHLRKEGVSRVNN